MPNYALVDSNGLIVNMAAWDGEEEWNPGDDLKAIKAEDFWVSGGSIVNGKYNAPETAVASEDELKASNNQMKASLMDVSTGKLMYCKMLLIWTWQLKRSLLS